ncbi:hypothetical protein PMZ80_003770 [Knufia obscura]|uniref:N-acetyltransferase domain-containing protein n=1 Tax=Knufia obscura TaxID=1635080 RepID=A0ABR0RV72_9EURO|nr:hypothetical protein PMZ80_003770 [Knufia obscura]
MDPFTALTKTSSDQPLTMPPKRRASPPLPILQGLRFATPKDIWRANYQQDAEWAIRSENVAILVVEDHYDPAEVETTAHIVPKIDTEEHPMPGEKVVAGVAAWRFLSGSSRAGQLANTEGPFPDLAADRPHRDEHEEHVNSYHSKNDEMTKRYFGDSGWFELDTLVIHPTYWRRGHGRRLLEWGMRLADIDQAEVCICATTAGLTLYRALGCELLESWNLEGDEMSPAGVAGHIVKYVPRRKRDHSEDDSAETAVMALSERLFQTELGGEQDKARAEKNGQGVR